MGGWVGCDLLDVLSKEIQVVLGGIHRGQAHLFLLLFFFPVF